MNSLRKALLGATAAAMLSFAIPAMAADQDFTLHNHSGHEIKALYVSPTSEDHWGPNILGESVADGGEVAVKFDREETECKWDVRVEFEDGTDGEVHDVDFCSVADVDVTSGEH